MISDREALRRVHERLQRMALLTPRQLFDEMVRAEVLTPEGEVVVQGKKKSPER